MYRLSITKRHQTAYETKQYFSIATSTCSNTSLLLTKLFLSLIFSELIKFTNNDVTA
jgi:hypothetical protein